MVTIMKQVHLENCFLYFVTEYSFLTSSCLEIEIFQTNFEYLKCKRISEWYT